jgi:dihydrofolate reductase
LRGRYQLFDIAHDAAIARLAEARDSGKRMAMARPPITLIVARAQNGVIGRQGKLPWHLPADLRRFKALTMGSVMVMGRKTFESLPGPLPGRRHIVLTRDLDWSADGAEVARTVDEAMAKAGDSPVAVIGGAEIFGLFLPLADRIELTEVLEDVPGDTFMPDPRNQNDWKETHREIHGPEPGRSGYSFLSFDRVT